MEISTNAMTFMSLDGMKGIEPHHAAKLIDGVEIDLGICDLIEFLWNQKIDTLRSCENMNGLIYIAFRNLEDAIRAGLLVAQGVRISIVTNSVDGGYAAPSIFIPIEYLTYPMVINHANITRHAKPIFKQTLKELTMTGLVKRAYSSKEDIIRNGALVAIAIILQNMPNILVVNDGKTISVDVINEGGIKRSKKELLELEAFAVSEYKKEVSV